MDSEGHKAMSEVCQPKIQEVIEHELSARGGGMMMEFLGIFTYIDDDGNKCWARIGEVPVISAVGMVDILQMSVRAEAASAMGFQRNE